MTPEVAKELLDGLTTSVLWVDADHAIQYMNLSAAALLYSGPTRAIGKPLDYFFPDARIDWRKCENRILTLYEQKVEREDGVRIEVSITLTPYDLKGQRGWLVELIETARHTQILEEEERWLQHEAGAQLARTLAHEIKNPLAGIYGATQLLQKKTEDDKAQQLLTVIAKEVKRLEQLVDRMLGPKGALNKAPHNIHDVIAHVLEATATEKPNNVTVRLDFDPSIPELMIDFDQMVQVLLNLVRNAFQAMEKHGGMLTVRTRVTHCFTLGNRVMPLVAVIQVIDEGEGIPPELFDSIFYPMVTSKEEGTGLGLAISQAIVRRHEGLIAAQSEPGKTIFSVYLPIMLDEMK